MFCYFQTRVTCRPKSRCQSDLSTVSVLANKNLHQDLMHSECRGTAVQNVCLQAFSLFALPSSPLDKRPVHRLPLRHTQVDRVKSQILRHLYTRRYDLKHLRLLAESPMCLSFPRSILWFIGSNALEISRNSIPILCVLATQK